MRKIRVLIVDDSVVIRRMLSDILAADAELEVAGAAANGRIALAKIPQVNPDLVTLDIEMPEMDGLQTLTALRKTYPRLPVIMFSTFTQRGATATLEALSAGAGYVACAVRTSALQTALFRAHGARYGPVPCAWRTLRPCSVRMAHATTTVPCWPSFCSVDRTRKNPWFSRLDWTEN